MEEIVQRIRQVMEQEGYSPASFADELGIGRPLLSHVLGGRNNPSLQLIITITQHFPQYSADWIINGRSLIVNQNNQTQTPKSISENTAPLRTETAENQAPDITKSHSKHKFVSNSQIERIVIFYSNGTFEAFNPSK